MVCQFNVQWAGVAKKMSRRVVCRRPFNISWVGVGKKISGWYAGNRFTERGRGRVGVMSQTVLMGGKEDEKEECVR